MSRKFLFALMQLVVTLAAVFILSKTAAANACSEVGHSSLLMAMISGQEQYPELVRLRDKISGADSLNEARTLALTPTAAAIGALKNARFIMPFSEDLRLAETRLADTHLRIAAASTPDQVANEFSGMLAGFGNNDAASVNTHSRIQTTNTPDQVANEFPRMMLAGLDNDKAASLKIGKVGCSYSTGGNRHRSRADLGHHSWTDLAHCALLIRVIKRKERSGSTALFLSDQFACGCAYVIAHLYQG